MKYLCNNPTTHKPECECGGVDPNSIGLDKESIHYLHYMITKQDLEISLLKKGVYELSKSLLALLGKE